MRERAGRLPVEKRGVVVWHSTLEDEGRECGSPPGGVPAGNPAAWLETLRREAGTGAHGTTLQGLAEAARKAGLKATGVQVDRTALLALRQPAIAWLDGSHYQAVLSVDGSRATVHDPNRPGPEQMEVSELHRRSGGILLLLDR